MLPFKRVLFPVDYSQPCRDIVPYVKDILQHFDAGLTLVHAMPAATFAYAELIPAGPSLLEDFRPLEEQRLQKFASENFPGQHAELIVEEGEAGTVIHNVVQHQGADLVMMPTLGYGPVRRFLLGSVTAKVLHDVSAAVWTGVGSTLAGHQPGVPYRSIICALDETEEAEAVLKAGGALAHSYNAELALLHVVATPPMALEIDFAPYRKELMDSANLRLRNLKKKLGIDAPHIVTDVLMTDSIREEAVKRKADLIVTGRGEAQGTFSRVWSRLYPLIRESPCPVLSI